MSILADIFTSKSRASIMEKLFDGRGERFYLRQLEKLTGLGIPSLRDEILRLNRLDLIKDKKSGNRIYYWANSEHPLYITLKELVSKTSGPRFKLEEAFKNNPDIDLAFIFGSYATGETHAKSDIDLFVLGRIKSMDLSEIISDIEEEIGYIEINSHNYSKSRLKKSIKEKRHFLMSIRETEKIYIKGSANEFEEFFN